MRWKTMTGMQYSMGFELGELYLVDEDMGDGKGKGLALGSGREGLVDDDTGDGGRMGLELELGQ